MTKLIVHIGHGKTGSSSIQKTLSAGRQELLEQGVAYLGLMLEHGLKSEDVDWQVWSGSDLFFAPRRDPGIANAELFDVLSSTLEALGDQGISQAIWSNEWLAPRAGFVIPALKRIVEQGHDVEVQCYIRRHDKWAISAYSQWGLKHKSYRGSIRTFVEWLPYFGDRNMRFASDLAPWDEAFGASFYVYNFDAISDVAAHFIKRNALGGLQLVNDNISPTAVEIAAQAVFNSCYDSEVRPEEFNNIAKLLGNDVTLNRTIPPLDQLFPKPEDLSEIVEDRAADIARLNEMLVRNGQPILDFSSPVHSTVHPNSWEMDQYILRLLFSLSKEVTALRHEIDRLKQDSTLS